MLAAANGDPASLAFFNTYTVQQFLAAANVWLGGGSIAGFSGSTSDLNYLATKLNEAFDNGSLSSWALVHLE